MKGINYCRSQDWNRHSQGTPSAERSSEQALDRSHAEPLGLTHHDDAQFRHEKSETSEHKVDSPSDYMTILGVVQKLPEYAL